MDEKELAERIHRLFKRPPGWFTVVGFYNESDANFVDHVEAKTALEAKATVVEERPGTEIIAVFPGTQWNILETPES